MALPKPNLSYTTYLYIESAPILIVPILCLILGIIVTCLEKKKIPIKKHFSGYYIWTSACSTDFCTWNRKRWENCLYRQVWNIRFCFLVFVLYRDAVCAEFFHCFLGPLCFHRVPCLWWSNNRLLFFTVLWNCEQLYRVQTLRYRVDLLLIHLFVWYRPCCSWWRVHSSATHREDNISILHLTLQENRRTKVLSKLCIYLDLISGYYRQHSSYFVVRLIPISILQVQTLSVLKNYCYFLEIRYLCSHFCYKFLHTMAHNITREYYKPTSWTPAPSSSWEKSFSDLHIYFKFSDFTFSEFTP